MDKKLLENIKKLREETGAPLGKCREALLATDGDLEKAKEWLRQKGAELLDKKKETKAGQGIIAGYVHFNGRFGALVELRAETDFVSQHEDFKKLAYELAIQVATMLPQYIDRYQIPKEVLTAKEKEFLEDVGHDKPQEVKEKILQARLEKWYSEVCLLDQPYVKNENIKVRDLINESVSKFREKIEVTRFVRLQVD